jgi:hypothetical protein
VYLWQGRQKAAERQASYALAIDSTHKAARELRGAIRGPARSSVETSAKLEQRLGSQHDFRAEHGGLGPLSSGVGIFGSMSALEASDPVRDAARIGGELGLTLTAGHFQLTGSGGARRLDPETAEPRTAATYRGQLRYRPTPGMALGIGYSRLPFDEIASLIERELDMELLEGGLDAGPLAGLTVYAGGGTLWLSDGKNRWILSAGLTQKILRHFFIGAFGRTLSYERPGIGYFSPIASRCSKE